MQMYQLMFYLSILSGILLPFFLINGVREKENDTYVLGACICSGVIVFTILSFLK